MTTLSILLGLLLAAYGIIFKRIMARIQKLEDEEKPDYSRISTRLKTVEDDYKDMRRRQDNLEPVLTDIKSTLSKVEEAISWFKKLGDWNNNNRK